VDGVVGTGVGVGVGFGAGAGAGVGVGVGAGDGVEGVSTDGVDASSLAGASVDEELSLQLNVKKRMRMSSFFMSSLSCLMSFQVKAGKFFLKYVSIL